MISVFPVVRSRMRSTDSHDGRLDRVSFSLSSADIYQRRSVRDISRESVNRGFSPYDPCQDVITPEFVRILSSVIPLLYQITPCIGISFCQERSRASISVLSENIGAMRYSPVISSVISATHLGIFHCGMNFSSESVPSSRVTVDLRSA
jgi:hypothetical protein